MKKHCIIYCFCCLNMLIHTSYAYNLKQVADKEYMSNSSITSLCQDERGLMWIGTCDGLNIYDGQDIEEFKTRDKEDYLSGNLIDNIIYTGDDTYWVQTYYGLNRLDRRTNAITHYNEFQKQFFMNKDNRGTLFIIQDSNCIYYYNKKEEIFKKINITGIPISDILAFFVDGDNQMWIIMKGYSRCYDINLDAESGNVSLVQRKNGFDYQTSLLYCFNDEQNLYYVDKGYNFYTYNIQSKKKVLVYNLTKEIQARGKITAIVRYHNSYFIGFLMDGVLMLEKDGDGCRIQPLSINSGVFCLKKDRFQDIVWIGTDGQGVYLYSNPLYSIKSVVLGNYTEKIERPVRALYLDQERTFWIGTKGSGILKIYDYEIDKSISACQTEILTTANSVLGSNAIYCFAKSRRNVLWIGDEEGLSYYSYRERRMKKLPVRVNGEDFKYIHDIYETANSELWLASVGMGVAKARIGGTPDNPILEEVQRYVINEGEFGSNYFFTIYPESDMKLLFGNKGYGVFRFNETTSGLEPITTHKYENVTLNNILAISKDSSNNYLFGTSYGLIKYTSENTYQLFNTKNGFLNNTIHAILKNSPDNFWLSTNLGLINFDAKRSVFRSYGFGDGLNVVEFSDGASFRDEQTGTLFFGGINGFIAIRADGRPEKLYMPPVYFDKLSIFGEQYNLGEFLTREKDEEVLNLKYDQNFFAVSFTSVDYLNGNNCVYYYKLKGLSEQWINNGSESAVSFTNMAPGEYTLLVKYYNSVFDKESDVYSIIIRIGDPWYASWWAYSIYTLCLLLLAGLIVRSFALRSRRKKQKLLNEIAKRHQKNVFESKLRFFTNIAHEFCTPLTLIYGPCGRILSSKGLSRFVVDYVQMIQTNAERLNNLIHELIEFRRIETGNREIRIESINVSALMRNTAKTFVEMAKSRDIIFLSKIPDQVSWNSDKGFLNTIVINLISNAFKYTPDGKHVKIEVDTTDVNSLILRVANEGSSIKEEDFQYIFNRYAILDNFEKQDEKNFSRNGLGLAISYNMAKLLNGKLKVENTPDGWVLFTLTLPTMELSAEQTCSDRVTSGYVPSIDVHPAIKLPRYEVDKMRPTLLVIDDEVEMLWFIGEIFSADFNVVPLQEPEKIEQVMNEVYPDVIISDIMMQGMNGIELTKRIKSVKETAHIPIIIVSGRHEMEQQMEALSAGAEMYITKPFNADFLRISVFQMMERKEVLKSYFSSPISSFEKSDGKLTHKETKKFLQSVLKIINNHITDRELSPRFIADKLAISSRSLYRKMEEMGEDSPTNLIKECRLHIAKDLLLTTKKTIDEIVFDSGFSNKVTFFKAFREKYECTPKEFRMKHLEEINL
ncbi:hybrid sensor histidine kinase/response regulator transcription factor [Bacteroides reticulotermitis]|uniref:histidine kinase n=2 Tax=Bacteroides reticulotermitis TaxID=1133319 RepID=W4UUI7_9BACE|nr:hybrid sensor histidine kinase/response regulator transcription factor [Bacteroides reticulotermitis]MBB4045723.1 signal transduction histidine kinase/ligand-binding sensor domain-containing protein/DNA-binding response OmpR family regulator [Bacteroides reticulotermitis]GAE84591.1 two-component system sensor histidine kinase/response regulator [Bacteroides reticulotermitis JCM 10512]